MPTWCAQQERHLPGLEVKVDVMEKVELFLLLLDFGHDVVLGAYGELLLPWRRRLDGAREARDHDLDRPIVGRAYTLLLAQVVLEEYGVIAHLYPQLVILFVLAITA